MAGNKLRNQNCTGCHACMSICPKGSIFMKPNKEGFLYPKVDTSSCINCNRCVSVCPLNAKVERDNKLIAYSCINKDDNVRIESSSGGIFTLLAEKVIAQDGVVFGAGFADGQKIKHYYVNTKEGLSNLRGSKYVQSEIGDSYKQAKDFLELGRKVLFSGTPCQIAGLKSYLGKIYNNLFTIDLVCHGVPSPNVWREYVEFRESEARSPAQRIAFRRKDEGWKRYSVSFLFKNNTEYRQNFSKDPYMKAFLKDICLRPSCYNCRFKTLNRQSDVTLADFWGVQNLLPEMDDDKGISLVFINSQTGQALFEKIKDDMIYQEVNINEAIKYNPAAIKSAKPNKNRDKFFKDLSSIPFDKLVKKYCTDRLSIRVKRRCKSALKKIIELLCLLTQC